MRKHFTLVCGFLGAMLCFGPAQGQGVQRLKAPARTAQPVRITERTCGTMDALADMIAKDPGYAARLAQYDRDAELYARNQANNKQQPPVYSIPIVFHVVGTQSVHNVATDARIMAQLNTLNDDYRKLNADITSVPTAFQSRIGDSEIEFCLASTDPNGQPTTGIERRVTTVSSYSQANNQMKFFNQQGLNAWNRDKYLNIWLCNIGGGILGYAQFPGGTAATDGVVCIYNSIPGAPGGAPYNLGRTMTHEVGHWLNLRHIWGDEPACAADDLVTDTPQQKDKNFGCPNFPLTSGAGARCSGAEVSAMFMNYMDYTDDACMFMFSQGQATRMRAALTGARASLITNNTACSATLNAGFIASATSVAAGSSVNFTDQSSGGATSWSWTFQGATPATSTAQNPSNIVYNTPGTYNVSLTVTSSTGNDTETKNGYITVLSPFSCLDSLGAPFSGTPTLYVLDAVAPSDSGFVSGNNVYGDLAKAELFSNVGVSDYINGASIYFGYKADNGPASQVNVTVWDATGTGGSPGAVLRTVPVNMSSISTNGATVVNFNPAIPINGNFYIGVELPSNGDTVAIMTNQIGQAPAGRAWEQWSDNTWHTYTASWNISVAHKIFATVSSAAAVANFTANGSASICTGGTVTFNAGASTNATAYNWSFPGGSPATSTSATPTVTYATAGNYNVSLAITGACASSTDTEVKNNFVTVTGGSPITISNPTPIICIGSSITLTASGAANYVWTNTQTGATVSGATVTLSPTSTTSYTISGSSAAGCPASGVAVIIVQNPQASFTPSANTVLVNAPVTFTNTSTGGSFNNWSMPGGNPNASNQSNPGNVTYSTPGMKIITLTHKVSATCTDVYSDTIMVVTSVGLPESVDNGVVIYPNPVTDGQLTVKTAGLSVREVSISNAIGQVMSRTPASTGDMQLDLSRYSKGIYFVTIVTEEGIITRKISVLD